MVLIINHCGEIIYFKKYPNTQNPSIRFLIRSTRLVSDTSLPRQLVVQGLLAYKTRSQGLVYSCSLHM